MKHNPYHIILFFLCVNFSFSQEKLIIPHKGIEEISVVLDSTNITEVFKIYGDKYLKSETASLTNYQYKNIGLTFQISPFDKNQVVRSILIEAPFQAKTENGIVLNKSTMKDVLELYNEKGGFVSKNYVIRPQKGISFYIKKDPKEKGFDTSEKIFKIEVHNDDQFGSPSRVNFEFNSDPIDNKLKELISLLKNDKIDFKELDSFWQQQKKTEKEPFGIEKNTILERKIEKDLVQQNIEIRTVSSNYILNIIKANEDLVYLKLSDQKESETLFERNKISEFPKLNSVSQDFDFYIFGTFCGIGGTPPDKCLEMLSFVRENNYEKLAEWVNSINPEIATYGYVGLDFLKTKGTVILPIELNRMSELKNSEIQLNTCQGCMIGVTEKIIDILNDDYLKRIYETFESSGWLK